MRSLAKYGAQNVLPMRADEFQGRLEDATNKGLCEPHVLVVDGVFEEDLAIAGAESESPSGKGIVECRKQGSHALNRLRTVRMPECAAKEEAWGLRVQPRSGLKWNAAGCHVEPVERAVVRMRILLERPQAMVGLNESRKHSFDDCVISLSLAE